MTTYNIIQKGTVEGTEKLLKCFAFLKNGSYFVTFHFLNPQMDEKTYRGTYFMKLQFIANETGHDKATMHEIVKEHVIFAVTGKGSTKELTLEEWIGVLQAMEIWAFQTYSVVIP